MKTLALSALAAVMVHAFLFTLNPAWTRPQAKLPEKRAITISLVPRTPKVAAPNTGKRVVPLPLSRPASIEPLAPLAKNAAPKPRLKSKPAPRPIAPAQRSVSPAPQTVASPKPVSDAQVQLSDPIESQASPSIRSSSSSSAVAGDPDGDAQASTQASVPRYDLNPKPDYPSLARRRAYEGTVLLRVFVDSGGRAAQVQLLRSSGYEVLDRSATQSVTTWRFEPARRNGRPIPMWVEVPVRFELQ